MTSNVKVSGIPANIKLGKLIPMFSNILTLRSSDFLLRVLPTNGSIKEVLLCLPTYPEAQLVQQKLDDYIFEYNNGTYMLTAAMETYKPNNKMSKQKSKFQNQPTRQSLEHREEAYSRDRSRSPHYEDKSSQLDIQIEILRKQRMILEEERKLLEEQRKLEKLKMELCQSTSKLVATKSCDEDIDISGHSPKPSHTKFVPKQNTFYQASTVLINKMNRFIKKHSSLEERKALLMHLRSIFIQRLTALVAADNRGVWQTKYTNKVVKLYRSQYSEFGDEEVVIEAMKSVREGCQTAKIDTVEESDTGANAKNKPDGSKGAAGDHITLQDNMSAQGNISDDSKVKKKFDEKRLYFHKASGVLLRKMNKHVMKQSTQTTRKLLIPYLRSTLKQRLAAVVAGQPIYQTHKIINMYRAIHPDTEDEALVKQLNKDIEEGCVTDEMFKRNIQFNDKDIGTKTDNSLDDQNSVSFDSKIVTGVELTEEREESSQPDNMDEEKKILKNQATKSVTESFSDLENAEKNNDKVENDLQNDSIGDNVDKLTGEPKLVDSNGNAKTNCDNVVIDSHVELVDNSTKEVKADTKVVDNNLSIAKNNENLEKDSQNDLVSDDIEKDITNLGIVNNNTDNHVKTEDVVTEATRQLNDFNMIVNPEDDNRSNKRKIDIDKEGDMKVPKTN